jgi:hypothetical protein
MGDWLIFPLSYDKRIIGVPTGEMRGICSPDFRLGDVWLYVPFRFSKIIL